MTGLEGKGLWVKERAEPSGVTQPGHVSRPLPPQKDTDEEVREFLHNNLHLQGKVGLLNLHLGTLGYQQQKEPTYEH